MTYRHIALMGRARSGKDTIAAHLGRTYNYTRVAFADPLKEMALEIDPIIGALTWESTRKPEPVRLSELVEREGWERAKDSGREVRRFLQHLGQAQRKLDEDYWLNIALAKIDAADKWNLPVVVTDVRYPNEALTLAARGFKMVRIVRPDNFLPGAPHDSETALDAHRPDFTLINNHTVDDLRCAAERLVEYR